VLAGALSIPLWVRLAQRIGKRRAWYISIWIGILASLPFAFLGPGDTVIFLACVIVAGLGLGSGLLHPAMQADVIDYDELHTGKRREAQYASFWSIVPKFVAIPSAAVPLAILAAVGYVPNQEQPPEVLLALRVLLGLAGPAVSLVAFFVALRFPMTEDRHREVLEGIAAHGRGEPARDPLTNRWLRARTGDLESEQTSWFLDHFSHGELRAVLRSGLGAPLGRVLGSAAVSLAACGATAAWVLAQIGDLAEQPGVGVTLGVVASGFAFSGFVFHMLRVRPALRLRRSMITREDVELHLRDDPLDPEELLPPVRSAVP
jgi:GPH family glycoside/pentoside/hexuronide:cation symporter